VVRVRYSAPVAESIPSASSRAQPVSAPFAVAVDTREQMSYTFRGLRQRRSDGGAPLVVRTQWRTLRAGDYSIVGYEDRVAIERKTLADLYSTLAQGRDRFEAEFDRLAELDFAAIAIESTWETIAKGYARSLLSPESVIGTAIAWAQRYGVHWMALGDRHLAEAWTYRALELWWRDYQEAIARPGHHCRYCGRALTDERSIDCGMGPWCRKRKVREDM